MVIIKMTLPDYSISCSLWVLYCDFNNKLSQTGAGLEYSEVTPGSDILNVIGMQSICFVRTLIAEINIDKLLVNFLHWEHLHGYWQTLPNFNLVTIMSDPGQNLEEEAIALVSGALHVPDNNPSMPSFEVLSPEECAEVDMDPDAEGDDDDGMYVEDKVWVLHHIYDSICIKIIPCQSYRHAPSSASKHDVVISTPTFGLSCNGNKISRTKLSISASLSSKKVSPSSGNQLGPGSTLGKWSALTAFGIDAENDSHLAATLCSKKLDHDMANFGVQKAKIDLLAQREAAQNAHKAEEHEIHVLQLHLQMHQTQKAEAGGLGMGPGLSQGLQPMVPANADAIFGNASGPDPLFNFCFTN